MNYCSIISRSSILVFTISESEPYPLRLFLSVSMSQIVAFLDTISPSSDYLLVLESIRRVTCTRPTQHSYSSSRSRSEFLNSCHTRAIPSSFGNIGALKFDILFPAKTFPSQLRRRYLRSRHFKNIQLIQNSSVRLICALRRRDHVTEHLNDIGWLGIQKTFFYTPVCITK